MTIYPNNLDTDLQLPRIEDNITEIGGDAINQIRDAIFAMQDTMGINPQGVLGNISARFDAFSNPDGTFKTSALAGQGLVTLPITSSMFNDDTIPEIKFSLDHSTASLFALISNLQSSVDSYIINYSLLLSDFNLHVGGSFVNDGYLRHVASHIDINDGYLSSSKHYVGTDPRDLLYYNIGLIDADGYIRSASTVMDALIQINSDLVLHMLSLDGYHNASFVKLDTSLYTTIPTAITNVQEAFDFIDDTETIILEAHRSSLHSTGIPREHNVTLLNVDGYNLNFGPFVCKTKKTLNNVNEVEFTVAANPLEWALNQIVPGDYIRINYGGFEAKFPIEFVNYIPSTSPSSTYKLTIDGYHPIITDNAYAILEKANYDENHYGILAACPVNHNYYFDAVTFAGIDTNLGHVPPSVIVVTPNCASATGIDLCLDDLDSEHYNLYIAFYPTADPTVAILPPSTMKEIDVTGNQGATPGAYTLNGIIDNVNRQFRKGGYNYRMVAFEYKGQFGLAIADTIDNPGFSIIYGISESAQGPYVKNVIDITNLAKDPLGFGPIKSGLASPVYSTSIITPTKVFVGRRSNKYNVNGQYIDYLNEGFGTTSSYYDAKMVGAEDFGGIVRQRGIFRTEKDLSAAGVYPGSTIVLHPYSIADYGNTKYQNYFGRFIVENVIVSCDGYTELWTVDCCSWNGIPTSSIPVPDKNDDTTWIPMKMYFSNDSVTFRTYSTSKDYYEIFVRRNGNTFSHRRASLPLRGTVLDTTKGLDPSYMTTPDIINFGWHIVNVSPRLRGFTNGGTTLNKYVRFVVSRCESPYQSYTAYICQPNLATPLDTNPGPTINVKVGEAGRFYDNTGVDYIDIMFDIDPANPVPDYPATILTINEFVDIEIFDSIRENGEYLCLASCERLDYLQGNVANRDCSVWDFKDLRQFGTISEKVLTTSAIKFIESGNRWLHQNGTLNGFDLRSVESNYVSFTGGVCLIDGVVINKNDFKVFPINMWTTDPDTVNYVLCIKKDGTHEMLPLANTSNIAAYSYSATVTNINLRQYTLSQIIEERKDLLPVYIITVITGLAAPTFLISDTIIDIRKFITNNEVKGSLVLYNSTAISGTTSPLGNFKTWEAVSNYIKNTDNIQNTILVRGTTTITDPINFGGKPVNIIGDPGNVVFCKVDGVSLNLNSNMKVDGINFIRSPVNPPSTNLTPYTHGKATVGIVLDTATIGTYKNITINNCTFTSKDGNIISGNAHILFEKSGDGAIFHNIKITNNSFLESKAQLDIAFTNLNGTKTNPMDYTVYGAILHTVIIDGNTGNKDSWIMLSSDNYATVPEGSSRGLSAYNVKITNNSFWHIWYNLSRYVMLGYSGTNIGSEFNDSLPLMKADVIISDNTFNDLMNRAVDGTLLGAHSLVFPLYQFRFVTVASPSMIVSNNRCTSIHVSINGDLYFLSGNPCSGASGAIIIKGNNITSSPYEGFLFSPTALYAAVNPNDVLQYAIIVIGNMDQSNIKENLVTIDNNIISNELQYLAFKLLPPTLNKYYTYNNVIVSSVPCNITGNNISYCISEDIGNGINLICITPAIGGLDQYTSNISNNIISKGLRDINSYINILGELNGNGTTKIKKIVIKDNVFDGYTNKLVPTGSADYITIKYDSSIANRIVAQRNVGQMFSVDLTPQVIGDTYSLPNNDPEEDPQIGWKKYSSWYDGNNIHQGFETAFFALFNNDTTCNVSPIIINLPCIDGATGLSITFIIEGYTLFANQVIQNIRIFPSIQTSYRYNSYVYPTLLSYPVRNITNSNDNFFTSNGTEQTIQIDISKIYNESLVATRSSDRYFPLFLSFFKEDNLTKIVELKKIDHDMFDYIRIKEIIGKFVF
ncbi:MAG: hypothetical protein ACOYO1_05050 [Bacteroidales bacterium]